MQDTELKFDLVSPVDELAKQIRLEFDFVQEAQVMDTLADSLQVHSLPPLHCQACQRHATTSAMCSISDRHKGPNRSSGAEECPKDHGDAVPAQVQPLTLRGVYAMCCNDASGRALGVLCRAWRVRCPYPAAFQGLSPRTCW